MLSGRKRRCLYNGEWKRGRVVEGYRFKDGIVTIETPEGNGYGVGKIERIIYRLAESGSISSEKDNERDRQRR